MIGWALGKFAPNLANLVRKLWSTRMVTVPKSYAYRNVPINKWPKDISKVKMNIPVGFTTKKVPFEQGYAWNRPMGGIAYQAPTLKKTGATFLPKGTNIGGRVVVAKAKEPAKIGFVGATGTALGYASTQKKSTAGISTPRVQRKDVFPAGKFGKAEKRLVTTPVKKTRDRFFSGSYGASSKPGLQTKVMTRPNITQSVKKLATTVKTRPSIASYQTAPKAKVPVAKAAKTTKVTTPVRKMESTSRSKDGPKKVSRTIPIATTAASKSATAAGILTAKIIRKFGITQEQVRASDISQKKRLLGSGTIKGPKKTTSIKSPFAGDIVKQQASGYHIFRKGSKGALSFRAAHKAAKGKKFKWIGTGKWYSGA